MDLKIVKQPYEYLLKEKGKEVRVKLVDAFNKWTQLSPEKLDFIKELTQKLHNASLLIDDIEDNSKQRRGKPCSHLIFGIPTTINSANYMYFEALQDCLSLGSQEGNKIFTEELLNLHIGQGMDIFWRDNNKCPTESEYIEMVKQKTGGLFRLAIGLMNACSNVKNLDLIPLVNDLSIHFQILDDYLNLQSTKYHENKSFCEDLTEGKFSFPIIHHVNQDPNDRRVLNILTKRSEDILLKKYALVCMNETQSFKYTLEVLREYEKKIKIQIKNLGGNKELEDILDHLMKQIESSEDKSCK